MNDESISGGSNVEYQVRIDFRNPCYPRNPWLICFAISVHTSGAGIGPKNIRSTFSLPITRTSSCIVQYMAIITKRMIWIAQKCGHTISASNFSLPATKPAGLPPEIEETLQIVHDSRNQQV